MLVTLINPTNSDLTVNIFGLQYSLNAKSKGVFPAEVALYWVTELHQFLEIEPEAEKFVEEVVEKPKKTKK